MSNKNLKLTLSRLRAFQLLDNKRGYHTEFYLHNLSENKGPSQDKFRIPL